jgi:hypothetical protein
MPTDLNTSIQFLKERVDKTLTVQTQISATWLWRHKTLAQWEQVSSDLDKTVPGSLAQLGIAAETASQRRHGSARCAAQAHP